MPDGFIIKEGVLEQCLLKESIIEIPNGVFAIGEGALKGGISIEKVILPDTVKEIRKDAFKGCRKLKEIHIPKSVCLIGEYAFHRCHSLKKIELPDTVQELFNCTFLFCDSLEFISMPGVKRLGKQVFLNDINLCKLVISKELELDCICDVFTGCSKIREIECSDHTTFLIEHMIELASRKEELPPLVGAIVADVCRMMELDGRKLLKFLTNLKQIKLPEGIEEIGKSCFFDKKGILSIQFPSSLKKIGSKAFRNCINLEQIEFSKECVQVETDAFKNCTTLRFIQMADGKQYELSGLAENREERPELVQNIHNQVLGNFQMSGTELLRYFGNENRVTIPEGITVIGERAFAGNEAIDRIILPDSILEIKEEAFADCVLLQTISFPEGLTFIGKSAFEHCVKLIRVNFPSTLVSLSDSAFNRCKVLSEVHFETPLKDIAALAFYGCTALKKINLEEGLEELGDMAFYKCISLKEVILPESLKVLGSNVFTASGVRIAEIRGDFSQCGSDIFSSCSKLKKLIFHENVQYIGDKFAYGCKELFQVEFPSALKKIGRNAFESSRFLKNLQPEGIYRTLFLEGKTYTGEISIPEGITIIAGGAFYGNKNITKVNLPQSLCSIGARAFCGCTSLITIRLPEHITVIEEGTFAYCVSMETVETEGVIEEVEDNAFYDCRKLQNLPVSLAHKIGDNAFFHCESLSDLSLSCTYLGASALEGTGYLNQQCQNFSPVIAVGFVLNGKGYSGIVELPEGIQGIAPYAFAGNEEITEVILPESIRKIGEYAFAGCHLLQVICCKSPEIELGKHCFEKCTALNSISISKAFVLEGAFTFCTSLETVLLGKTEVLEKEAFAGCHSLRLCICESVYAVLERCFSGCESLSEISLPAIKEIGSWAFWSCNSLKSMEFKQDVIVWDHAFEDCGQLEQLIIMKYIQLGSYAFSGCTALSKICIGTETWNMNKYFVMKEQGIPDLVKRLYASAISCFQIDENNTLCKYYNNGRFLHIPDGIQKIESEVFKDKGRLSEVKIPESVVYIGARALHGTKWIEQEKKKHPFVIVNQMLLDGTESKGEAVIPAEIVLVSGWAFARCLSLTGVHFLSNRTKIEEYAFRNCVYLKQIQAADGTKYQLKSLSDRELPLPSVIKQIVADCYNCFKMEEGKKLVECTGNISKLLLPEGIEELDDFVFKDSNLLSVITVSNSVIRFGKGAFCNCKWLTYVWSAIYVERVEEMAFSGCIRLLHVELSQKLCFIGKKAFENCTSLQVIEIPEGIEEIPERAFYRCQSLKQIILPSTLKRIEKEAFAFCYELERVEFRSFSCKVETRAFAWCKALKYKTFENVQAEEDSFCFCGV